MFVMVVACIGCLHGMSICIATIYARFNGAISRNTLFASLDEDITAYLLLCLGYPAMCFPTLLLAGYHCSIIPQAHTTIEEIKNPYRDLGNPYDKGSVRANICAFLSST